MKTLLLILLCTGVCSAEVVREISGVITKDNVNGRVGINFANGVQPSYTLDVNGNINSSGSMSLSSAVLSSQLIVGGSVMVGGNLEIGNLNSIKMSGGGASLTRVMSIGSDSHIYMGDMDNTGALSLRFRMDGADRVTILNTSGNVGIGTIAPGDKLEVNGSVTVVSTLSVQGNTFSVGGSTLVVNGGKVGIGTTNPDSKLHVSSGTLKLDGTNALFSIVTSSTIITATDPCALGDIRRDADYIYVCTAANTWKRAALSTWP